MTQPAVYTRSFSFTAYSTAYPSNQQPGVSLDGEFNAVKATLDQTLSNLALIQRDDGKLANDSVTLDQVANDVLLTLGTSWVAKGPWATATAYAVGNVVSGSGTTYVCSVAHTSGVLATDVASGYWLAIFSLANVTPSDGTVTTAKIVDGAVSAPKLGFTSLDMTGTFRAQGGVAGGTAIPGSYAVAGAAVTGAAYLSIARGTQAQGIVGVRLDGGAGGTVYELRQAASSNDLAVYSGALAANVLTFSASGPVDCGYTLRATGQVAPAAGAGVEISYAASIGYVNAYDRTGGAAKQLNIQGLTVLLVANGTTVGTVSASGADFTGLSIGGKKAGYLGAPINAQSGNYTLAVSDCGKRLLSSNTGAQAITIAAFGTVAIPIDDGVIMVINDGTTAMTIVPAGGVTLRFAGGALTGTRTLAVNGIASLMKVGTDEWFITGSGLT